MQPILVILSSKVLSPFTQSHTPQTTECKRPDPLPFPSLSLSPNLLVLLNTFRYIGLLLPYYASPVVVVTHCRRRQLCLAFFPSRHPLSLSLLLLSPRCATTLFSSLAALIMYACIHSIISLDCCACCLPLFSFFLSLYVLHFLHSFLLLPFFFSLLSRGGLLLQQQAMPQGVRDEWVSAIVINFFLLGVVCVCDSGVHTTTTKTKSSRKALWSGCVSRTETTRVIWYSYFTYIESE